MYGEPVNVTLPKRFLTNSGPQRQLKLSDKMILILTAKKS